MINNNTSQKGMNVNNVIEMHNGAAWDKKGIDAEASDNYSFAVDAFSKSIEMNPHDAYTYYRRGGTYSKLGNIDKAIEDFNKYIRLKPDHADAYIYRGTNYYLKGKDKLGYVEALKAYSLGKCGLLEYAKCKRNNPFNLAEHIKLVVNGTPHVDALSKSGDE